MSFNLTLAFSLRDVIARLDLFTTDIAYDRMRAAIQDLNFDPEEQEQASTPYSETVLQGTYLRDVLLSSFAPPGSAEPKAQEHVARSGVFAADQLVHSWARRYRLPGEPVVVEGDPDLGGLNATQRRAVALMLNERVSLVQGVGILSTHIVGLSDLHW